MYIYVPNNYTQLSLIKSHNTTKHYHPLNSNLYIIFLCIYAMLIHKIKYSMVYQYKNHRRRLQYCSKDQGPEA